MKLYHISQTENNDYDTYSDLVVCAASEEEARLIHPRHGDDPWKEDTFGSWCKSPESVTVECIGDALPNIEPGIICASFHAG